MPKDEWKLASDRAKYGPVRYSKKPKRQHSTRQLKSNGLHHKFELPVGMLVSVCRDTDDNRQWEAHTMRKRLRFHNEYATATCRGTSGAVIFRFKGFLILARRDTCQIQRDSHYVCFVCKVNRVSRANGKCTGCRKSHMA